MIALFFYISLGRDLFLWHGMKNVRKKRSQGVMLYAPWLFQIPKYTKDTHIDPPSQILSIIPFMSRVDFVALSILLKVHSSIGSCRN